MKSRPPTQHTRVTWFYDVHCRRELEDRVAHATALLAEYVDRHERLGIEPTRAECETVLDILL